MKTFTILLAFCVAVFMDLSAQNYTLDFDGSNDYVQVGAQPGLIMSATLTLEAWIYPEGTGSGGQYGGIIVNKEGEYEIARFANGNFAWAFANSNPAWFWHETPAFIPLNQWSHVAVTYQSGVAKSYLNGVLVETYTGAGNIGDVAPTQNDFRIGGRQGTSQYFNGKIEELMVWNLVRTDSDIQENVYREFPDPMTAAGLVVYYKFNQTGGTNLPDYSALGYHGTLTNMSVPGVWQISTAPVPYQSVAFGMWQNPNTWNIGQLAPVHDWARVAILTNVTVDSQEEALEVVINSPGVLAVEMASSLTVSGDLINNVGNTGLVLQSDAGGIGSLIENDGVEATVQRYFSGNDIGWHLIGSPVTSALSGVFTDMYLQEYSEATGTYQEIIPVNVLLNPMQGYGVYSNLSTFNTVEFAGNLNTGNVNFGLTAFNPYGWNLLSNPYSSSIDWDMVTIPAGMNNAVYYLDAVSGSFLSYNGGIGGGTRYIPPMQGFFVSANTAATLSFDNNIRTHTGANSFYKDEVADYLVIKAEGNNFSDKTYVRFDDAASQSFDSHFDAYKIIAGLNEAIPQVYTIGDNENLSIQVLPFIESIHMGFESMTSGVYTFSAEVVYDLEVVILEDLLTGTFTDLKSGDYTFSYSIGEPAERFMLHFNPLGTDEIFESGMSIYSYGQILYVNTNSQLGEIRVYNLTGQEVIVERLSGNGLQTLNMEGYPGYYVVKIITDSESVSQKVFIK